PPCSWPPPHRRSTNTLSRHRPRPSMLTCTPADSNNPLASAEEPHENQVGRGSKKCWRGPLFHRGRPLRSRRMADSSGERRAPERRPAGGPLPQVYAELRRLPEALTPGLPPGQTLHPTALVPAALPRPARGRDPGRGGPRRVSV